ncbi:hypothetical protein GCM10029978_103640 [Actinoallomurus acanthiterrae]
MIRRRRIQEVGSAISIRWFRSRPRRARARRRRDRARGGGPASTRRGRRTGRHRRDAAHREPGGRRAGARHPAGFEDAVRKADHVEELRRILGILLDVLADWEMLADREARGP